MNALKIGDKVRIIDPYQEEYTAGIDMDNMYTVFAISCIYDEIFISGQNVPYHMVQARQIELVEDNLMTNYYNSRAEEMSMLRQSTDIIIEDDTPVLWDDEMVNALIDSIEDGEAVTQVTAKPRDVMDITRGFFK